MPPHPRTVPGLLAARAAADRDRVLFACGGESWTVGDAASIAAGHASALAAAGVGRGDRVALFCSNRPEFMRVVLGCAWLGAIAVPVNVACRGPQLQYYLANSGARLLAIESGLLPELAGVDAPAMALERVWVVDGDGAGAPAGWAPRTAAMPGPGSPAQPAALSPGDTVAILYTSGTT
ncbi:MAG: AMP-binding protein, partial [Burkholderiales bacterium]|nr:AMP-binding protein [Burkholderiales bacterium]